MNPTLTLRPFFLPYHRYGYHIPRRDSRDNFYRKLEDQRAAARQ
jgi:hypothetical protein